MKYLKCAIALCLPLATLSQHSFAAPGYNQGGALPNEFKHIIQAADHGVIANDSLDDSAAIQAIIDSVVQSSDSEYTVIQLPEGEIILNDEVHIDKSGLVIRGAGSDPKNGTKVVIKSWSPYTVSAKNAPDFNKKYWPGFAAFRVETRLKHAKEQRYEGSINYHWKHGIEFAKPASLGDSQVRLKAGKASQFEVGQLIYIGAANDNAFLDMSDVPAERRTKNRIKKGHMRTQLFKVTAIDSTNDIVSLDRPLEFNIPLRRNDSNYPSRAMPVTTVKNFGLQDFYLTMDKTTTDCAEFNSGAYSTENPKGVLYRYENVCAADAIHGIILKFAENGWVDNVQIEMIGSHPIVTEFAKDITISNNKMDGSWNKGAGGNGYFRASKLYDSWLHNNSIKNVRHMALQWSATGNIVENNYLNVDLNLHGGWERNNLIRKNTIEVPFEHRSWSKGAPEENATWQPIWVASGDHASKWAGPTGPNNVLVDNDFKKAKTAGAPITRWKLFDEPGVEYALNWDGSKYKHVNIKGVPVSTWNQALAEGVFADVPNSGVAISGGSWVRPMNEPVASGSCGVMSYVWSLITFSDC